MKFELGTAQLSPSAIRGFGFGLNGSDDEDSDLRGFFVAGAFGELAAVVGFDIAGNGGSIFEGFKFCISAKGALCESTDLFGSGNRTDLTGMLSTLRDACTKRDGLSSGGISSFAAIGRVHGSKDKRSVDLLRFVFRPPLPMDGRCIAIEA